ncbi:MAG: Fe-S cluster assembly protein SufD [Pirellulales bacterium]
MTVVATSKGGFSADAFQAFAAGRSEPEWLTRQRQENWRAYEGMAWPSRTDEEWIRTDIRQFKLSDFALPGQAASSANSQGGFTPLLSAGVSLGGQAISVDSRTCVSQLSEKWQSKGVIFGGLDELAREHGELIQRHLFARAFDANYDRFAALHAATWSGGHFLYVPRNVTVDEPMHLLSAMSAGGVDLGHTLIILEEGAEATVLSETASRTSTDGGLHCGGVEVIQGAGSRLRLVSLQNWGHGVWNFAQQKAVLGRGASLQWTIAAIGSRLSKVNQHVELAGKNAECQVNGVLFAEDKQHISYHTLQHHVAANCHSDFLYKAALQDKARTVWRGMIKVDQAAQKTDGYQRNDNLLLSNSARADSIPGLEIEADDVRCTHGSTTGKVNEELIFYAQARGFTRKEATRMIVSGFFQQIFDRITIESVRDALGEAISHRVREYV